MIKRFGIFLFCIIILSVCYYFSYYPLREGYTSSWYNNIDVVYYINLDHRTDRKDLFLEEMQKMNIPPHKIIRIPGVYKPGKGDWGCSLSHLHAIKSFHESNYQNCIIFEDDFVFTQDPSVVQNAIQSVLDGSSYVRRTKDDRRDANNVVEASDKNSNYDVCMLSCSSGKTEPTTNPLLLKLYEGQTASGYMVSKPFSKTLLQNYQEGSQLIEQSYLRGKGDSIQHDFCIDQYWKRLQPTSNWFVFEPKLGKQRDSFSDIQGGFVKMTV
jgi:GR25 family glycosyltransferase involved in LPS biosynthesis